MISTHNRRSTDLKLIFVPLIFFVLRIWSAIIDILHYSTLNKEGNLRNSNDGLHVLTLLAVSNDFTLTAIVAIIYMYVHLLLK